MKTVTDIVDAFGGLPKFSKTTGIGYSAAQSMKFRGQIDPKYWKMIAAHAQREGIEITISVLCDVAMARFPDVKLPKKRPRVDKTQAAA